MERKEAYTLLMELISLNLALPSIATLKPNRQGFDLVLKGDFNVQALKDFSTEKNLIVKIDERNSSFTITKAL